MARYRIDIGTGLFILTLGAVGFLVLYPLLLLVVASFEVGPCGREAALGFGNWISAFTEPNLRSAILNTLTLTAARQGIGFVVAIILAWFLARTDLPGRDWLEFGFWVSFFLPTLPVLLGWIFLLDGHNGLINRALAAVGGVGAPSFEIYSWWGIVFVHLMTNTIPVKVMLLTPAFRNLDSSLTEAAQVAGAGAFGILRRIVAPILAPTILVVVLLGTLRSLEAFEIEFILGPPARIDVYSTAIYRHVFGSPPDYGPAFALGVIVFLVMVPFVLAQQKIAASRSRVSIGGKFTQHLAALGRWRWAVFAGFVALLAAMTVLPVAFMLLGSFMEVFGYFDVPGGAFTAEHWRTVLHDPQFLASLWDTLSIAALVAVASMVVFPAVAYLIVRSRYRGRGLLDFLTWIPTTVPGIVIGLMLLWMFLRTPFLRPAYGTDLGLVLAFLIAGMALGVQIVKAGIMQIAPELEEAARIGGASWLLTLQLVVVPLVAPTVVAVGVLQFVSATRAVSTAVLLSSQAAQPLAVFQLKFIESGDLEAASVVGVVVLLLSTGVAFAARIAGLKLGLGVR